MWKWVTESKTKPSLSFCFFFFLSFLFKDCLCLHDLQGNWKCTRWSSKAQNLHKYVCFIFASSELFLGKKISRQKKERIWWVKNLLLCFTSDNILAYICTRLSWCHWMDSTRQMRSSHTLPQHTAKVPTRRDFLLGFQLWFFKNQEVYFKRPFLWIKLFQKFYEHVWNIYIEKSSRFNFWD